jgi:hypothetical protein
MNDNDDWFHHLKIADTRIAKSQSDHRQNEIRQSENHQTAPCQPKQVPVHLPPYNHYSYKE